MNFKSIFQGLSFNSSNDTTNKEVKNILQLKEKLTLVGYHPDEVDYMIKTQCNGREINKLDIKKLKKIQETLQEQLFIAKQCIKYAKGSK